MDNSDHSSKISIEDLLHLKRAERPAADFWADFERELRQKQLSALVEKRSWWNDLPQLFARRIYLPIGATAILTFSVASLKYYSASQVAQPAVGQTTSAVATRYSNEISSTNEPRIAVVPTNREEQGRLDVNDPSPVVAMDAPSSKVTSKSATPLNVEDVSSKESPYARSIAANLARLEQSEPELINSVLGSRLSSSSHLQASSAPVVELASLSIGGSKRTRLLARYNDRQLNTEPTAPDAVRERISRRLGDSESSDRFTRIGVKADQVSLKF